jgi:hypothetical protein
MRGALPSLDTVHMSVQLLTERPGTSVRPTEQLFAYTATRGDQSVVELQGVTDGGEVTVVVTIRSVRNDELETKVFTFPTFERAHYFAHETLVALEYVGCAVHGTA